MSFTRFLITLFAIFSLCGMMALQSLVETDETPRAEIERLIGVDIASSMGGAGDMSAQDMSMAMSMPEHHPAHKHQHHRNDACPLCPLLQIGFFLAGIFVFARFFSALSIYLRAFLPLSRAPPKRRWALPLAQAPPLS